MKRRTVARLLRTTETPYDLDALARRVSEVYGFPEDEARLLVEKFKPSEVDDVARRLRAAGQGPRDIVDAKSCPVAAR